MGSLVTPISLAVFWPSESILTGFYWSNQISVTLLQKVRAYVPAGLHGWDTDSDHYKIGFLWSIDNLFSNKSGRVGRRTRRGAANGSTASEQRNNIVMPWLVRNTKRAAALSFWSIR
jgi:hypothetical protein